MIRCPVCNEDLTVAVRAGAALFYQDVPLCSAECRQEWQARSAEQAGDKILRSAVDGWLAASITWAVLFFGLWNMPATLSAGTVIIALLLGIAVGSVAFWRTRRRLGNAAGLLDF